MSGLSIGIPYLRMKVTPSFLATSRALRSCLIGRSSIVAAAAVPYTSTPLTRGITRSFEPTLGMILIYGMNGTGGKSHRRRLTEWVANEVALSSGINELETEGSLFQSALCGRVLAAGNLRIERSHSNT